MTNSIKLFSSTLLCVIFALFLLQEDSREKEVYLHSEWSAEDDDPDAYYSQDIYADMHWRQLKRGGGGGGGFGSSSRSRSTGNCYGDRCDNMGGSEESMIIVGSVIGGCCFLMCCYVLV